MDSDSAREFAQQLRKLNQALDDSKEIAQRRMIMRDLKGDIKFNDDFLRVETGSQDKITSQDIKVITSAFSRISKLPNTKYDISFNFLEFKFNIDKKIAERKESKKKKKSNEILKAKNFIDEKILSNKKFRDTSDETEQLKILIDEIRKIKEPPLQKIVLYFLFPLLVLIIYKFAEPFIDEAISDIDYKETTKITKKLKKTANKVTEEKLIELGFSNVPLSNKRIVIATKLNVREKPTKKSRSFGYLEFGNLVTVIRKRKNWTFVEFKSYDSQASLKGWVFTRYIKRIDN